MGIFGRRNNDDNYTPPSELYDKDRDSFDKTYRNVIGNKVTDINNSKQVQDSEKYPKSDDINDLAKHAGVKLGHQPDDDDMLDYYASLND